MGPLLKLKVLIDDVNLGKEAGISHPLPADKLELASGSDCVLSISLDASVPEGCICMDAVQAFNLRLAKNETYAFKPFEVPPKGEGLPPFELCDLDFEVRLMPKTVAAVAARASASHRFVHVSANQLAQAVQEHACGTVVAVNQSFVLPVEEEPNPMDPTANRGLVDLALRVTCTNTLEEEQQASILAGYHCYRGLLTPETKLYFYSSHQTTGEAEGSGQQALGSSGLKAPSYADLQGNTTSASTPQLVLEHPRQRPSAKNRRDTMDIHTKDVEGGEIYTVKRALLRPCIALTSAIRDESLEAPPSIDVDVDTLTFDRVLIFLESRACNQEPPQWSLHLIDDLAKAAALLGLCPLASYCEARLNGLSDNLRLWRFEEVVKANSQGRSVLILDGMILDVTEWLPEHPGGSSIIPAQALNLDCGRFFEIYHASKESFLYLRDFYLGELHPEDRKSLHQGRGEHPSDDFLSQLREYSSWRLNVSGGHHAGDHLHLGRSAR